MKKMGVIFAFGGLFVCIAFGYDWTTNPGGGTSENPYQISTAEQLMSISSTASLLSQHFIVMNNIDLTSYTFTTAIIAPDSTNTNMSFDGTAFTGTFDGRGHTIKKMNINTSGAGNDYLGLFGYLGTGAIVKNLTLETISISGGEMSYYLGGITGYNKGTIRNCHIVGTLGSGDNSILIGGIAGESDASITQCSANVYITVSGGSIGIGGLVGQNSGQIQRCFTNGRILSWLLSYRIGGLVGDNVNGTIENSYSGAKVVCDYNYIYQAGGLVGRNYNSTILNSYSTGQVSPNSPTAPNVGGFIGLSSGAVTITNCFWDINTSGRTGSAGGTGKTTAEMKTLSTFTGAGWDFVGESANGVHEIWRMCVDGVSYPRLSWEYASAGDFACADGVTPADLLALAAQWLTSESANPTTFNYACDADSDGFTNQKDFDKLSKNWPESDPRIQSSTVGKCTHDAPSAGLNSDLKSAAETVRFTATVEGRYILFSDPIEANCCINGITLSMHKEQNHITLEELISIDIYCTCMCTFPTTAVLGPFAPGEYVFGVVQIEGDWIQTVGVVSVVIE